jgi:predicted RNA methylase
VLLRQWTLVALLVGLVLVVARLEQPLRGLVDLGVVSGLGYGLCTLLAAAARALGASRRAAPEPAPSSSSA